VEAEEEEVQSSRRNRPFHLKKVNPPKEVSPVTLPDIFRTNHSEALIYMYMRTCMCVCVLTDKSSTEQIPYKRSPISLE